MTITTEITTIIAIIIVIDTMYNLLKKKIKRKITRTRPNKFSRVGPNNKNVCNNYNTFYSFLVNRGAEISLLKEGDADDLRANNLNFE